MMPSQPMMIMNMKTPDQEFWEETFQTLIMNSHDPNEAAKHADTALALWRERWPQDTRIMAPTPPFQVISTGPTQPPALPALDRLVEAQNRLDAARKQLEATERLAKEMPKEMGEAYYDVAAPILQQQIEACESWVKSIQDEIEHANPPASGGGE